MSCILTPFFFFSSLLPKSEFFRRWVRKQTSSSSSIPSSSSDYNQSLTSFETTHVPQSVAYSIRPDQVPYLQKALLEFAPVLGCPELEVRQRMPKSTRHDTQVLFVARDAAEAPLPQELLMLSSGRGANVRILHTSMPIRSGSGWYGWAKVTAASLGLQEIKLPHAICREDLASMLRMHASRSRGLQEHKRDTHLIDRIERLFGDIVFVFRRTAWALDIRREK
ncbi:hypothetical protein CERZMDRAFT_82374 [Cercospora zeae-maydis SCOH1-5]|uniref:Uncharacterized protein n=1 Tax=Cercospora zeae-maydis SCOH1-5 TaxID=717836 RepID=A0A6A6FPG7_9PEZI|nr:hypothetical protein CERZMDRAFT_82374 [Cercospora zeae-maydis SCOH1-5]